MNSLFAIIVFVMIDNIMIFTFIKIEFQFPLVYVYLWVSEANIYTIKQSCKKNHKVKLEVT
jgi:hypothetical protein